MLDTFVHCEVMITCPAHALCQHWYRVTRFLFACEAFVRVNLARL